MYSELTTNEPLYTFRPGLTGLVSYTPIVVQFVPSVLQGDGTPVFDTTTQRGFYYYLQISCPESNKLGTQATLPERLVIPIPQDGLIRLQLVPTTTLLPQGYYIVEYFKTNSKKPILTQHWAVPELAPNAKDSYTFTYESSTKVLPLDVWEVLGVNSAGGSLGDTWRAEYNRLFWEPPEPLVGTPVTVVYKQALTLNDIVLHDIYSHDRNRIRY